MHQASRVTSALDLPCCWWAYLTSPQLLEFYWFDVENEKLQLSLAQKNQDISKHIAIRQLLQLMPAFVVVPPFFSFAGGPGGTQDRFSS